MRTMRPILLLTSLMLVLLMGGTGCGSAYTAGSPFPDINPDLGTGDADLGAQTGVPGLALSPVSIAVPGGQRELAVGDLDGDLKPEVVATLPYEGKIAIAWNAGTAQRFTTLISAPGTPYGLALAPLNGDTVPDLAYTDQSAGTLNLFYTTSSMLDRSAPFTSAQPVMYALSPGAAVIQAGFLNNDPLQDLAVLNSKDGTVSVFLNQGTAGMYGFADRNMRTFPGPSHYSMALLPGRLMGVSDILVTSASDDTLTILRNNGSGDLQLDLAGTGVVSTLRGPVFVTAPASPALPEPLVYVADSASNQLQIWNSAKGNLTAKTVLGVTPRPVAIAVGDLDGDAFPDLVVASSGQDELQVLLSRGGNYLPSTRDRLSVGQSPVAVAVADLNGNYEMGRQAAAL